jgi:hypothetical protein
VPLSVERMGVRCVREEVSLAHKKAQVVVHDYEQIEEEQVGGFELEEEEHGQIGLDLKAKDSEEEVDDEDTALVDSLVSQDNRTGRVRSGRVVCWWESKANCQEDMRGACRPEYQEEGSHKDGLQGELKDMVNRPSVLVLLVGCWMHRSQ